MKKKERGYAIECNPNVGPVFGDGSWGYGIYIGDNCNKENSCSIENDCTNGYECHPEYKLSSFVNTAEFDEKNKFTLSDYEAFGIDYEDRYNINKVCKYPNIIWEYIETKYISEYMLKQVDNDTELLSDLDAIHCEDSNIRLKISLII